MAVRKKKAKARKPGRPALLAESEKQRKRTLSLDDATVAALEEIGEGSVSEGIRRALAVVLALRGKG